VAVVRSSEVGNPAALGMTKETVGADLAVFRSEMTTVVLALTWVEKAGAKSLPYLVSLSVGVT
jgi:hypothetical protein